MGDAFRCDACEGLFEGTPEEKVLERRHLFTTSEIKLRAELCEGCADDLAEFLNEGDGDE